VKLRILVLIVAGTAGLGSSYALANDGNGHHGHDQTTSTNGSCQRAAVFGTAAGPQTFVVTVSKSGRHSSLAPGQVVTVTVGSSGQPLRFAAAGCVSGSSVTVRDALLSASRPPTTTQTTSTATTTTAATTTATTTTTGTTTSSSHIVGPKRGGGGKGGRHGHGHGSHHG
jgi:hypothetical protein